MTQPTNDEPEQDVVVEPLDADAVITDTDDDPLGPGPETALSW